MEAVSSFVIFELEKRVLFCFGMIDGVGRIFDDVVSWTFQLAGDRCYMELFFWDCGFASLKVAFGRIEPLESFVEILWINH